MPLLPLTNPGHPSPPYGLYIWKFNFGHSIPDKSVVLLGTSWRTPWWEPLGNSMATHWRRKQKGKKVWWYWEHLGEHIDGNPLGTQLATHWSKKKSKKEKNVMLLLGTSWRTHWWEPLGNSMATHWSMKETKGKKRYGAIGNILENTLMGTPWEFNGNTLMGTLWELNGNTLEQEERKKKKEKKVWCCYWKHLGQHIDGNSLLGTQWQKK